MPIKKLTGAIIQNLKPKPDGTRVNYFDSQHKGLCLRVGTRDKTWTYHYRFNGKSRSPALGKYALGRTDHLDRAGAIDEAAKIDDLVEQGLDPKFVNKSPKPKPTTKNPNTFKRRVQQFLKIYKKSNIKPQTYKQGRRLLESTFIESLNQTDVGKISRAQIVKILEDMDSTPANANRLHAYMNNFFLWCWDREYVDPSPMVKLKKRFPETPRRRFLDKQEIKKFWAGCEELGYPLGDWCRFTLATGQRPGECRNLIRGDIYDGIWLVAGGSPKNNERHRIPLPKIARDIIRNAPKLTGPFVFSITDGEKPRSQGGKTYDEVYKAVGLTEPWRPHDLRRTFQTWGSEELDIEPHLLGAICNQLSVAKPGVASTYNQAKWMGPKKDELEAWNDWLLELVKDDKSKN